jgi:uncharacterized protein
MSHKVIRTICYFAPQPVSDWSPIMQRLAQLYEAVRNAGYEVQTLRLCSPHLLAHKLPTFAEQTADAPMLLYSWGTLSPDAPDFEARKAQWLDNTNPLFFNIDLDSQAVPSKKHIDFLLQTLHTQPQKLFHFAYTAAAFDNRSPFFPSSHSTKHGFSIGLQSTNLAQDCPDLPTWLDKKREIWHELNALLQPQPDYLGIDSSVAPLYEGASSLFEHIRRWYPNRSLYQLATSPIFTQISRYIKTENPAPIGLCGIMMPCLEDFELAKYYQQNEFNTERNLYLSLHSGLGIDTFPFGIDQDPARLLDVLQLLHTFAHRYKKPLSIRWISDGHSRIGDLSQFHNQFLRDAVIQAI